MVKIEGLETRVGDFKLGPINLELGNGEFLVLLGPSGSGKTLFLETLAGVRVPERGRVYLKDKEILSLPPEKRGISIVYQELYLFPHMTVKENILYGKRSDRELMKKLIDFMKIEHLLSRFPHQLSGGEKQRVALLRALVNNPSLLLLDEPFSSLDRAIKEDAISLFIELKKKIRITTIMVTHDFEEALLLGDRIAIIHEGKILGVDTPEEIFRKPAHAFIAEFTGVKNLLLLERREDGYYLEDHKITLATEENSDKVIVTLRPEDIIISRKPVKTSARNVLKGRVVEIQKRGVINEIRVRMNNVTLSAYITNASLSELELREGVEVYLVFKASALHVIK